MSSATALVLGGGRTDNGAEDGCGNDRTQMKSFSRKFMHLQFSMVLPAIFPTKGYGYLSFICVFSFTSVVFKGETLILEAGS